ncbi:MAG: alpha/beta fold hydrolase [SAR324 cluster bacterium]
MTELKAGLAERLPAPEWLEPSTGAAAGMRLAFRAYLAGRPRASVLISHGLAEHSGWWQHVALALQARGISAFLFDHFHHGQSAGRIADVPHYDVLAEGIRCALEQGVLPRSPGIPVVLLGHSNGGCAGLFALPKLSDRIQGLVLCSPLIRMPWVAHWLGPIPAFLISRRDPGAYWPLALEPEAHTTNAAVWPQYASDPLRFHKISARFYLAMRSACNTVESLNDIRGLPLLLLSAGEERIVDLGAMLRWYGRLRANDKTHLVHPGRRHELFNEVDWQRTVDETVAWVDARFPAR